MNRTGGTSINRFLYTVMFLIITIFALITGIVLRHNLNQLRNDVLENFEFRSELFKDSIDSNIAMGDYVSALKKADLFFSQTDVDALRIDLVDGTSLVSLHKSAKTSTSAFEVKKQISISDDSTGELNRVASVEIGYDLSPLNSILKAILWQGAAVLLAFLVTAAIVIFYFSRRLNGPLKRLSKMVTHGDLLQIASIKSESRIQELGLLEQSIGSMGKQLTIYHQKELENAKSLIMAEIAAQISHDLRAPLASFERLLYLPSDSTIVSQEQNIKEALFRLNSMIESMRHTDSELFVKPEFCQYDVSIGLAGVLAKAEQRGIRATIEGSTLGRKIRIDRMKFERALTNLFANALDASSSRICLQIAFAGHDLVCGVIDDGPGVSEEFMPRLFQRGATHGKIDGTGLGLAYVRQIMRGHGGDVTYRRENGLTIFECRLPNAVEPERDQDMDIAASLELQLTQKIIRTVAICLDPTDLSKAVLSKLTSFESGDFLFSEECSTANIVVSNVEDVMIEVLENDEQEYISVAQFKADEGRIVALLKKKFNLG